MKRVIFSTLLSLIAIAGFSQTTYVSLSPCVYNGTGDHASKLMYTIEVGRTYDVFNLGLAYGRTNLSNFNRNDTTHYVEVRPTLNVFSKGKFSAGVTLGAGHIINAEQNFMTEFAYSITYSATPTVFFSLFQGKYWFDGKESASTWNYTGATIGFNFKNREQRKALLSN